MLRHYIVIFHSDMLWTYVLCILLYSVVQNECARILAMFPTPSISHQVAFRPLTQELARRGHQVVVITPDPAFPKGKTPRNLTEIDVHDFSYKIWKDSFLKFTSKGQGDIFKQVEIGIRLLSMIFDMQLEIKEVQDILKQDFDLVMVEACVKESLVLSHIFKKPLIQVSSFGVINDFFENIGAPTHFIFQPGILRRKINNLTIRDKIVEIYTELRINRIADNLYEHSDRKFKAKFGKDFPDLKKLGDNVDMLFLNTHHLWDSNRPVPPNVIYIGGIHVKPAKELPQDLKSYLDSSKNGVIYMSFGTNVDTALLPPEMIATFTTVFSKLPYDVLWKWNQDELPGKSDNVRISKWLPQSDLLKHPKIKLFITQGGLQSTDEAILAGVPLLGIPMLGDQWFNVEKYVQHKIGLRLDADAITEDTLENNIKTIIDDKSFKQNIIDLRTVLYDQPQNPLDRVVWWTEHILRHGGGKHLRSPAANISWTEYLMLDVVLAVTLAIVVALTIIVLIIRTLLKLILSIVWGRYKLKKN